MAARLEQLAVLLREQGADRYKLRAYRNAAASLRSYPANVARMVTAGEDLRSVPGVGKSIASAIREIIKTGGLKTAERLGGGESKVAVEVAAAAGVPLREARRIVEELKVGSVEELARALEDNEALSGVHPKFAFQLRRWLTGAQEVLWADAEYLSGTFERVIAGGRDVRRVEVAGEVRRGVETVGALAYVVECATAEALVEALQAHAGLSRVERAKPNLVTARLAAGPELRVRRAGEGDWGDALAEETGSSAHLAEVRRVVGRKRFAPAATEDEWYEVRGLGWIPPEFREGRGEVAAAADGSLPQLIELADIRGDLHCHTTASDGANTLSEMVAAARAKGYSYLCITDHSKSLKITRGLDEKRLAEQARQIDAMNRRLKGFRVLKGSEVDILADGSLDFSDETLATLNIVIGSIHSRFGLDKEQQTARLLRAVSNPYLTCIGHMTGRLLLKRPGYEFDVDRVLKAVKQHGKLLEINSSPDRLDIDDELAMQARGLGIPLLINTDAHSTRELEFMRYGVQQGRRGWLSKAEVLNTLPLSALLRRLRATFPR